ncbi:hypothetical protein ACHAWF_007436 [Thalassiosira exigua]
MKYEQIFLATMGSMMTWGHMIWIFFPLPLFCLLLLLAVPIERVEKYGTSLVGKIFFTRVTVGPAHLSLVHFFIAASMLIFGMASRTIHEGFGGTHVPCTSTSCPFHSGETMWYRRASRHRAERNFWLSLFTLVLWMLVYNIYALKERIVRLRGELKAIKSDGHGGRSSGGGGGSGGGRSKKEE